MSGDLRATSGATSMQSGDADSRSGDADSRVVDPDARPGSPGSRPPEGSESRTLDPYDSDARVKEMTTRRASLVSPDRPFKPAQLSRIDEALTLGSRETGLLFSVYVGDLGESGRATAEAMFAKLADRHHAPVLVAISPAQRRLEIVTGGESARRIPNRSAALAALAMRGSFATGDLTGGIVTGLRQLADAAGPGLNT
ncbi:MAG TPA: DUF5130 family protein [Jatrophihabitans sp.]|uniref:DUF5130 family protein n=1 Tax=Jatrophihabitans sp. TaxID=1932789 RepID=UPI002EE1FF5F